MHDPDNNRIPFQALYLQFIAEYWIGLKIAIFVFFKTGSEFKAEKDQEISDGNIKKLAGGVGIRSEVHTWKESTNNILFEA